MKNLREYILNENNFFKNLGIGQVALIRKWLDEHNIEKYTINNDLTIDVKGTVDLRGYKEKQLPDNIQFGKVTKHFYICYCPNLESLKGCPQKVGKNFNCDDCPKLKTLDGCPEEIGIDFSCSGCPELTSLMGAPKIVGECFSCSYCPKLESLVGCPQKVGMHFRCYNCGKQFTKDDVEKVCKVKKKIITR